MDLEEKQTEPSPLETLVGDGRKFSSVDELAKAKLESDRFIEQLKAENAGLREDLSKRQSLEELVTQARESLFTQQPANTDNQPDAIEPNTTPQEEQKAVTSDDELLERIRAVTAQERERETRSANLNTVRGRLNELYGEKSEEVLKRRAEELGLGIDFLTEVAAKSPKAFFTTLGVEAPAKAPSTAPNRSEVNTEALNNANSGAAKEGTWQWYEELRKTNPTLYWQPKIQRKLHADAQKDPAAFNLRI